MTKKKTETKNTATGRVKAGKVGKRKTITFPDPKDPSKTIELLLPDKMPRTDYDLRKVTKRLETAIVRLINKKPFFGLVITKMRRIANYMLVIDGHPTMAVQIKGGLTLIYHPEFVVKHTLKELSAVLEHEVLHVVNKHFEREEFLERVESIDKEKNQERAEFHKWWNFAADIAINQYIQELPEGCLKPLPEWKPQMHTEYYFRKLQECGGKGYEGCRTIDLHDLWGHLSEEEQDAIRQAIRDAYDESQKFPGDLPGDIKQQIQAFINKPLPWNQILRRYLSNEVTAEKTVNYSRYDRRFDVIPGYKRKPTMELVIAFDTSGSVRDKDLAVFVNEIHAIKKRTNAQITLLHIDHSLQHVEEYRGEINIKIHGRGGTSFQPAFDWIAKNRKRANNLTLIYLTDGYGQAPDEQPRFVKTIWIYTPQHSQPCSWGRHIILNNY